MTKNSKTIPSNEPKKPRGRKGGRPLLPEEEKKEIAYIYLPRWLLVVFKKLVPAAKDRTALIIGWVRAYVIAGGETHRLLAQSPLAGRLLSYLEKQDGCAEAEALAEDLRRSSRF